MTDIKSLSLSELQKEMERLGEKRFRAKQIYSWLHEKLADATVLIVAQRISTILHADRIIVLDDGKIAGIGTHRELLAGCEAYREIARSQLSEAELEGRQCESTSQAHLTVQNGGLL